ncbi:PIF1-like helicase-domain-containing protein, partial [Lentinula edodes]
MPLPDYALWNTVLGNRLVAEQMAFDPQEQQQKAAENIAMLNVGQKNAFDKVMNAITSNHPQMLFLHGPAGTGKTFTYKTLCYMLRGISKIVLCCASSGLAALLLPKGRTAHSTFKIPIDIFEGKTCSIKKNSELAELLQKVSLII